MNDHADIKCEVVLNVKKHQKQFSNGGTRALEINIASHIKLVPFF